MNRFLYITCLAAIFAGCHHSDLDVNLEGNPFDPEYTGPSPFVIESFEEDVFWNGSQYVSGALLEFSVNESLFLNENVTYIVETVNQETHQITNGSGEAGESLFFIPNTTNPAGNYEIGYYFLQDGDEVCLEFKLGNSLGNGSTDISTLDTGPGHFHCATVTE